MTTTKIWSSQSTKTTTIYVNADKVSLDKLTAAVQEERRRFPDKGVFVKADHRIRYGSGARGNGGHPPGRRGRRPAGDRRTEAARGRADGVLGWRRSKGAPQAEINVTPLIDIVLVLLIIFMVMTPVMLKEIVAKVPQKQTENVPPPPGENPIVVELDAQDHITLNGDPRARPRLFAERIADRLAHDRQKVVFFKCRDDANYGRTVRIMDLCKGAGAKTLGIVTKDDR